MTTSPPLPWVPGAGQSTLIQEFVDRAFSGDVAALDVFFTLLKTRYGLLVLKRLRRHRGFSRTGTVEDILQDSMTELYERLLRGDPSNLASTELAQVIRYFQKLCDQKLENLRKPRKDPIFARHKEEVDSGITHDLRTERRADEDDDEASRSGRHRRLLEEELGRLSKFDRRVLTLYLDKVPYREMSRLTGRSEVALATQVCRLKERIAERIAQRSTTARLHQEEETDPEADRPEATSLEIKAAIDLLPVETKQAVKFVHLEGHDTQELAKSLGKQGLEKARTRLAKGYASLTAKLGLPFPESFSILKDD